MDTRHSQLTRSDSISHAFSRLLAYLEFQTNLLELTTQALRSKASAQKAYNMLVDSSAFDQVPIVVKWPSDDETHEIKIFAAEDEYRLTIYRDDTLLFTLFVENDQLIVQLNPASTKLLSLIDVEAIVHDLNQLFRVKKIIYKKNKREAIEHISTQTNSNYSKSDFDKRIEECKDYPLTYRINHLFVNNARRRSNNYTFTLAWPDALKKEVNHELKVIFRRAENFDNGYSWVLNEPVLLKSFAEYKQDKLLSGQLYYSFSVKEVVHGEESVTENDILNIWLTVDGLVGELKDLKKGSSLTGTDVLAIYRYLDEILKVKHTFICDASKLLNDDEEIEIPLRLLSALCTGKTWYQAKLPGVRLFDCKNFQSAFNGNITQDTKVRNTALKELQELKLFDWYAMSNEKNKKALLSLFANSVDKTSHRRVRSSRLFTAISSIKPEKYFAGKTVQDLAISLNNQAKVAGRATAELAEFIGLLTHGLHLDDELIPQKKAPEFWVLQRVHTLLWGSFFWIKELDEVKTNNEVTIQRRKQ